MLARRSSPSRFVLTGFSHDDGFRQFAFEGIEEDHVRTPYTVLADLTLARAYGIHLQDLPSLCRDLLERRAAAEQDARRLTFTEEDMRLHRAERLAAQSVAAQKRKPTRRPSTENTGSAWRTTSRNP